MRTIVITALTGLLLMAGSARAEPALTIYNQNFGVVRDTLKLDLQAGTNNVRVTNITAHLEPDSVILRDPSGQRNLQILEQNYRSDPISQQLLLSLYEGQTIDFQMQRGEKTEIIRGKIIRSGYVPHQAGLRRYGQQYYQSQMAYAGGASGQPIIEVGGKLRFDLPGIPLFPALPDDTILKPTLHWVLNTDQAGPLNAELAYVTGGMTWEADYNVVAPEAGDVLELVGWVTMDNQSGKSFENAKIKLMAGDVSKIQREGEGAIYGRMRAAESLAALPPSVTEKAFDEYHLYTLERPATLRDRETKQVEFVRAKGIKSQRIYVYDGVKIDSRYSGYSYESIRQERGYGTQSNPKVWVMREIKNTAENGLGIPLPKGRVRFYRRDTGGQLEFTGENTIDHTPKDETLRVFTGNAFDLVGERRQTAYKLDPQNNRWLDESFEIKLRNHKKEPVEVRVVEHLYRGTNWEITAKSNTFLKTDSQTIEFRVQVPPEGEKTITYT
ncbi:MAG: hypothetical protein M3347_11415, partial [Armatimonadota bacterium]|nr:hypothetical protein [Armatimonadota bacterium]